MFLHLLSVTFSYEDKSVKLMRNENGCSAKKIARNFCKSSAHLQ